MQWYCVRFKDNVASNERAFCAMSAIALAQAKIPVTIKLVSVTPLGGLA